MMKVNKQFLIVVDDNTIRSSTKFLVVRFATDGSGIRDDVELLPVLEFSSNLLPMLIWLEYFRAQVVGGLYIYSCWWLIYSQLRVANRVGPI